MSYVLTISEKHDYLHAKVTGANSAENIKGYLEEVVRKCQEANCQRLLIEEHLTGRRLDTLSVFEIASKGSASSRGLFSAIAYVDTSTGDGMMQFAENVAVNRGLPVKSFQTVNDAEQWLMGQE